MPQGPWRFIVVLEKLQCCVRVKTVIKIMFLTFGYHSALVDECRLNDYEICYQCLLCMRF